MKMKSLLLIIITGIVTLSGCCKNYVPDIDNINDTIEIPIKYKEYLNFGEESWWLYKISIYTDIDTIEEILDTIYFSKKKITHDSSAIGDRRNFFCEARSFYIYYEGTALFFNKKDQEEVKGCYYDRNDGWEGTHDCPSLDIDINNYFKNDNYIFDFCNVKILSTELKNVEQFVGCGQTDFTKIDTMTIEGVFYDNVLMNTFYDYNGFYHSNSNPKVWLTKDDWIVKLEYENNNTTFVLQLVDKHIVKN